MTTETHYAHTSRLQTNRTIIILETRQALPIQWRRICSLQFGSQAAPTLTNGQRRLAERSWRTEGGGSTSAGLYPGNSSRLHRRGMHIPLIRAEQKVWSEHWIRVCKLCVDGLKMVVVFVQVDDRALKLVPHAQILTNSKVRHRFSPTAILPIPPITRSFLHCPTTKLSGRS